MDTETDTHTRRAPRNMQAEIGVKHVQAREAKGASKHQQLGERPGVDALSHPSKEPTLPTVGLGCLASRTVRNTCLLVALVAALGNEYVRV